jgi:hypothetical protein
LSREPPGIRDLQATSCAPDIALRFPCVGPSLAVGKLIAPGSRPYVIPDAGRAFGRDAVGENKFVLVRV